MTEIKAAIQQGRSVKASELMQIPLRYRGQGLPDSKSARRALEVFRSKQSLFLTGITGSGKTRVAVALLNDFFAESLVEDETRGARTTKGNPVFLSAVELLLEIKESWRKEEDAAAESEKRILDKYSKVPVLVIDDLGAEKISDWSRQVMYLLIDRRYRNCSQTIITSNLTHQGLADQLDARIASRVAEMGAVIEMGSTDHRVQRGQA